MSPKGFLYFLNFFSLCFLCFGQNWDYKYYRVLDYEEKYVLGWQFNRTHIFFQLTVQTTGYVGFGISEVGLMNPADFMIGWISGADMFLGDYHTKDDSRTPHMDKSQDWIIQDGTEQNGTTVLRFFRKLDTCDPEDQPITRDRMQIIWSYSDEDPEVTSGMVPYHGLTKRGSMSIFLLEQDAIPVNFPPQNTFALPLKNYEYIIPATGSSMQCIVFDLNGLVPESHMIKYEADITPGNEAYVYRMNLYNCDLNDTSLNGARFDCETEAPTAVKSCKNLVAGWSMGAQTFHFPEGVGISMGGPAEPTFYVLEIHYSKYEDAVAADGTPVSIPDASGLQLTYTTAPITHKAGMLELGKVVSPGWKQTIPDGDPDFKETAFCSPRCMNWGFATDKTPITVIGVILKGNDVAKRIKLRHFREDQELPWIAYDRKFSNFFQAPKLLDAPITIDASDALSVECTYNTTGRSGVTRGGWSRVEELCRATLIYYPAKSFEMCLSWSSYDQLVGKNGQTVPENEAAEYIDGVTTWDAQMKSLFKQALEKSTERSICSSATRQPAYAIDRYKLPATTRQYSQAKAC